MYVSTNEYCHYLYCDLNDLFITNDDYYYNGYSKHHIHSDNTNDDDHDHDDYTINDDNMI